jgi:hypothetical protein
VELCELCVPLVGALGSDPPHVALAGGAVYVCRTHIVERYACRSCGALWERQKPRQDAEPARQWMRMH